MTAITKGKNKKMKKYNKDNLIKILCILPAFVMVLLTFNRLYYGTELTDEALYVAMPQAFINGMRPFATNWEIHQTSAFFLLPFLYIFQLITGNTEGLFLFSRIVYFVFTLFVATVGFFALKKYINEILAVYISFVIVTYAPFALYNASYNSLSFTFLLLGLFLLINAFSIESGDDKEQKKKKMLILSAGISHACLAFFYPQMVILSLFIGMFVVPCIIYYTSGKNIKSIPKLWVYYITGGAAMGVILLCVLVLAAGGLNNILTGINGILLNPKYGEASIGTEIISNMPVYILGALYWQGMHFLIYPFLILVYFISKKDRYKNPFICLILVLLPILALIFHWYILGNRDSRTMIIYTFLVGGIIPIALYMLTKQSEANPPLRHCEERPVIRQSSAQSKKLFILLYIPSFFGFLLVSTVSAGTYVQAPWIMPGGIILSAIFVTFLIEKIITEGKAFKLSNTAKKKLILSVQVIACLFFLVSNVFVHYNVVYRDAPIKELNHRVEYGIFKGIKTTQERKLTLENTERLIKSLDQDGKLVMAMENVPFFYLMSDMQPSVPLIWATTYYFEGFKNSIQILEYYSCESRIPDFIFFFTFEDVTYPNDPEYPLHTWINENFTLKYDYTDTENIIPFLLFERN